MTYQAAQGDIIWVDFSPSVGKEMQGRHPALVVSSNAYNQMTSFIMVCPITSKGNNFPGYIELSDYKIYGRVNAVQLYSIDLVRIKSSQFIDRIRGNDFLLVKQILDYALEFDM